MNFKEKYGPVALVAGASEGLGAAWVRALAKRGLDVILIARRKEPLEKFAAEISKEYSVKTIAVACDLGDDNALEQILAVTGNLEVGMMVYNAGLSIIGPYLESGAEEQVRLARVNMITPLRFVHYFGKRMTDRGRGGVILLSSLAGFQGSGFLTTYASTKAFCRVLAESLWYEWKDKGVDVIGCCAGATATPNYLGTKPGSIGLIEPQLQTAEAVVEECLNKIGKVPSFITGAGNRFASFFMNKVFSRKMAVNAISNATRKMYSIKWP